MTENNIDRISNIIRTQDILRRHDFNFKKKFGQNFLTDHNILTKITETADLSKEVNVIEIGPGIGSLSQYLLEEAAEVMAFEIDKSLIPILEETMAPYDNWDKMCWINSNFNPAIIGIFISWIISDIKFFCWKLKPFRTCQ